MIGAKTNVGMGSLYRSQYELKKGSISHRVPIRIGLLRCEPCDLRRSASSSTRVDDDARRQASALQETTGRA